MVVQVPVFGRVADVGRVQQQRQGFGFVNAGKGKITNNRVPIFFLSYNYNYWKDK